MMTTESESTLDGQLGRHVLWSVLVGSHAFGVAHEGSDYDAFVCYEADVNDILSGRVAPGGCHVGHGEMLGRPMDIQSHELSRWVDGVWKGNLNYMIGVLSPIVLEDPYGWLACLRKIVSDWPSTAIVASTLGMARHNISKNVMHLTSGDDGRAAKNLRTALRSLRFARRFIDGVRGSDLFVVDTIDRELARLHILTADGIRREMELLEETADRSSLPKRAPEHLFRDFQLAVRLASISMNARL